MSTISIPDLWSEKIRVSILSPVAILRAQDATLSRKTQGILRAEVRVEAIENVVVIKFDLVAPALKKYRITLLEAVHDSKLIYPAFVQSRAYPHDENHSNRVETALKMGPTKLADIVSPAAFEQDFQEWRVAFTHDEFIDLAGRVFQSNWVLAVIESLIAKSNESQAERSGPSDSADND